MEQFKQFNEGKASVLAALGSLSDILGDLDALGIDVKGDAEKVRAAIESIESDVLRIALLGAFSDGKTSVIAAWLGKVMEDMKIDMDESSDRVAVYKPEGLPGQCEIVDTPGLFGEKERIIDGDRVMYEDITKNYISGSHLILYVVDATNPLKESHLAIAKWVLRDLDKLSSTVFVINKMDEVTDLTEETLFTEQAEIKRNNLRGKLQRAADLSADEMSRLNIVCMAANPNGRGLTFWFGRPEQFESRSRINHLKAATRHVLQSNVPDVLRAKTGLDVVRDMVLKKMQVAHRELNALESFSAQNREEHSRIRQDLNFGRLEVKRLGAAMFEELKSMENHLLGKLRPLSMDDIVPFLEDEIGYLGPDQAGQKLQLSIKGVVDKYFAQSTAVTGRLAKAIEVQVAAGASFLESIGGTAMGAAGKALKGVSSMPVSVIKQGIFAARDLLSSVAGVTYRFLPWEATRLAGTVSTLAGAIGGAIQLGGDLYQAYKTTDLERQLSQVKVEIGAAIKAVFADVYEILSDDEKMMATLAPQLRDFESILDMLSHSASELQTKRETVQRIEGRLLQLASPEAPSD